MENIYNNLLEILLEKNKYKKDFINNKSIPTDFLKNILSLNNEKFKIKKEEKVYETFTLTKLKNQIKVSPRLIYDNIKKILRGITKDINNNNYKYINPILLILFYKQLEKDGYEFFKTINNNIEIRHPTFTIENNIRETLKLFISLFFNDNMISLLPVVRKYMILNFIVMKKINEIPYEFIDIYINMGKGNKIMINFGNIDINKDGIVVGLTNNMIHKYNYNNMNINNFLKEINDNIAQNSYKNNSINSIAFYITNNGIPLEYSLFFTNMYNSTNITLKDFIKAMESINMNKKQFNKLLKEAIKNKDIILLKNYNDDTIITTEFITQFLNYPRKKEWKEAPLIKKYYNTFTVKYFEFINKYLDMSFKKIKYIRNALYHFKQFNSIHKLLKISMLEYMEKVVSGKKLNIVLHKSIPILVYEKGTIVSKNRLLEKLYGHENIYTDLLSDNNVDNSIYLDLKYRIDMTESKENIINYRLINNNELKSILNL